MAEVLTCPTFNPMTMNRDHSNLDTGALCLPALSYAKPEPNPPFVFPLEPEMMDGAGSSHGPSSRERGLRKHSTDRSKPRQLSITPLPPFEFQPSASDTSSPLSGSPSRSPRTRTSFSSHSGGHRRNGSEFIGGDSRCGGQGLQSTSPTKGDRALPTPPSARTPPLGYRPRHAHRRSGAISSHDVSTIIKSANEGRGSSAPTTPSMASSPSELEPSAEGARSKAMSITPRENSASPPIHRGTISFEGLPRPRVGFSDTIEFIPRPLSTISSETSSTLSTIRAGHSVTGSITSIVSAGASSPPSAKSAKVALNSMLEKDISQPRPKTASPKLNSPKQDCPFGEANAVGKRPSLSSAAEYFLGGNTAAQPPVVGGVIVAENHPHELTPSISTMSPDGAEQNLRTRVLGVWEPSEPQPLRKFAASSPNTKLMRPRTSPERKVVKKQRKVKSWAGSILSRKAGRPDVKDKTISRRSPTPPPPKFASDDDFCLDDVNFDEDTSCVIRTPIDHQPRTTHLSTWKPRESSPHSESDGSSSILDLDSVLGLGVMNAGGDMDDLPSSGFSVARRKMHSSGATGGFSGPGMHYHRRADSLPEMAAISYHAFGFPSLGSNSTMADVFEEEEDDEKNTLKDEGEGMAQPEAIIESDIGVSSDSEIVDAASTEAKSDLVNEDEPLNEAVQPLSPLLIEDEPSNILPESEGVPAEIEAVEIVNADEEPRASVAMKVPNKSTTSPVFPMDPFLQRPASAPIDFAMRRPGLPFATPDSSCVSSPDFNRTSFDTPRMHTANSSITDRVTLGSCRTGETGLSIRGSVDDVPSLTSSASMVSARGSRFTRNRGNRAEIDRPSSTSTEPGHACYGHAGKRSSLASLSRLVGSSYGEKSKLHIEERVQPDNTEKTEKKKGNRISRLMRFWKAKEKLSST